MDKKWENITEQCHASYSKPDARVKPDTSFISIWPCFSNSTDLEDTFMGYFNSSAQAPICIDRMGANKDFWQREAKKQREISERELSSEDRLVVNETMKAFTFVEKTGGGPYRGRLASVYWYVALMCLL